MVGIEYTFLGLLIVIGAIASYYDIKTRRVTNQLVVFGFIVGLSWYIYLMICAFFSFGHDWVYLRQVLINSAISCVVALCIWYYGGWSAGDAKLFMIFSFLLPLYYYGSVVYIAHFYSFILLVNIFLLVLVYIGFGIAMKLMKEFMKFSRRPREYIEDFRGRFFSDTLTRGRRFNNVLKMIWGYLCIFLLIQIIRIELGNILGNISSLFGSLGYLLVIFLFRPLNVFFRKAQTKAFWLPTALLGMYIFSQISIVNDGYSKVLFLLKGFIGFMGMLFVIRFLIGNIARLYVNKGEAVDLSLADLKPRLVLTDESAQSINRLCEKTGEPEKFYADGLTHCQVEKIKKIALNNQELSTITIYKTFPFAPFAFLGLLATILMRGPLLSLPFFSGSF